MEEKGRPPMTESQTVKQSNRQTVKQSNRPTDKDRQTDADLDHDFICFLFCHSSSYFSFVAVVDVVVVVVIVHSLRKRQLHHVSTL